MNQFNPVFEEFFESKPDLLEEIKSLEQHRGLNLLKKMASDKDEINFFSWLSEVRFGLFFDKLCTGLKNNQKIEGKTPDWLVTINDQTFIAEVLRLNVPEEEYRGSIAHNRKMRKFQKENPNVPIITQGPVKAISLEYLSGGQSKLEKKEEKYRDLIHKHKIPFIICVAPTIETFLFELDFSDFLMGNQGFYKRNKNFRRTVTGILLNTPFGHFYYYHNEDAEYQLNKKSFDLFRPLFYSN